MIDVYDDSKGEGLPPGRWRDVDGTSLWVRVGSQAEQDYFDACRSGKAYKPKTKRKPKSEGADG